MKSFGHNKKSTPPAARSVENHYLNLIPAEIKEKLHELEQILVLPDWPENTRGVPNLYLRSSLFGVVRRGKRKAVEGAIIASLKGLEIRYTGWLLDQGDLDVMLQAFHLQNRYLERTSNNYIRFHIKNFLTAIGRQPGKSGREWLKDCFRRITATAVEINYQIPHRNINSQYVYAGSLIEEFYYDFTEHTYFLKINPKLAGLFESGWTQLQWQQRLRLKSNLAKWLHGFYATHRAPFPIKVLTLKSLCGSDCKRLVDFRRSLRSAMVELVCVGAVETWNIDTGDKLHVSRWKNTRIPK